MRKYLMILFVSGALIVPLQAQSLKYLEGSVFDDTTLELIPDATIIIPDLGLTTYSDADGNYAFWSSAPEFPWEMGNGIIPTGTYMVCCWVDGYQAEAGYIEFKHDSDGVTFSWSLDRNDNWKANATSIDVGNGEVIAFERFSEDGMKVFLKVPAGTFPDNSKFYIGDLNGPFSCSSGNEFKLHPSSWTVERHYRMFVEDEFGNSIHYFPQNIGVGFGKSYLIPPYIPPIKPLMKVDMSHFDYQSGTWSNHPRNNIYPGAFGLQFLMVTNHLSDWYSNSGSYPQTTSGVSVHGHDGAWWWVQVTGKTKDAFGNILYSIDVVNGYIMGSIDDILTSEIENAFINTETLSSQIEANAGGEFEYNVGLGDVKGWANVSSNVSIGNTSSSSLTLKSNASRQINVSQGDTGQPNLNGEIQVVEKGYDLWFLIELFKDNELWASWETQPKTFVVTGIAVRFVPKL